MPFLADYNPIKKQVKFINTDDSHKESSLGKQYGDHYIFFLSCTYTHTHAHAHTHAHTKRHPVQIEFYYHFCLFKLGLQCHNKLYIYTDYKPPEDVWDTLTT